MTLCEPSGISGLCIRVLRKTPRENKQTTYPLLYVKLRFELIQFQRTCKILRLQQSPMNDSRSDSSVMRNVIINEVADNSITISWTKLWDSSFLLVLVTSPLWMVMFAFLFLLLGGFVGGILHYTPLSTEMKETIATLIPSVLSIITLLGSIMAGVAYVILRKPLTTLKVEEGTLTYMKIQFPTDDINRITYYVLGQSELYEDDELVPEWMMNYSRTIEDIECSFVIQIHMSDDEFPFTVSVPKSDGFALVQYLSEYLSVPFDLDPSEGAEHLSKEELNLLEAEQMKQEASKAYHDWDNKTAGRWILDYFTKFLPRLFLGLVILGVIGLGIDYVQL